MEVLDGFTPRIGTPVRGRVRGLPGGRAQEPPDLRVSAVLEVLAGEPVAEVAQVLRCSEGTVKSQTSAGLAALRTRLGVTR